MAKRRKKRFAGFGLSKADHQHYATSHAKDARRAMQSVRKALAKGDCRRAISTIADAGLWIGESRAHSRSRSLLIKNRKKGGRGSVGGTSVAAFWSLAGRVAQSCAKERY